MKNPDFELFKDMPEAYHVPSLLSALRRQGVILSDDALKALEKNLGAGNAILFNWLYESAWKSKTTIDDMLSSGYPVLKSTIDRQIEKVHKD